MKTVLAWHFLPADRRLNYGDEPDRLLVEPGWIYSIGENETVKLCEVGMHGSRRAIDALRYATGPIVCRTRHWGDVVEGDDKLVSRHREVLCIADATHTLHQFACWCVRYTPIGEGRVLWDLLTDERSRAAVETKERWLYGSANDDELAAARDAARAAARAAARDTQNAELAKRLRALIRRAS